MHAVAFVWLTLEYWSGVRFQWLAGGLCVIAVGGALFHWGAPVLCTLAGYYAETFWIPSPYLYTHDAMESMMEDFGLPAIYATLGAGVGILWEFARRQHTSAAATGDSAAPSSTKSRNDDAPVT